MNPSVSDWPTSQPSERPSLSGRRSSQPSSQPSGHPSTNPSLSAMPQVGNPRHTHQFQIGLHLSHLLGQVYQLNHRLSQAASPAFTLLARQAYLESHLASRPVNPLGNHLASLLRNPHLSHHSSQLHRPSPPLNRHLIPAATPATSLLANQAASHHSLLGHFSN